MRVCFSSQPLHCSHLFFSSKFLLCYERECAALSASQRIYMISSPLSLRKSDLFLCEIFFFHSLSVAVLSTVTQSTTRLVTSFNSGPLSISWCNTFCPLLLLGCGGSTVGVIHSSLRSSATLISVTTHRPSSSCFPVRSGLNVASETVSSHTDTQTLTHSAHFSVIHYVYWAGKWAKRGRDRERWRETNLTLIGVIRLWVKREKEAEGIKLMPHLNQNKGGMMDGWRRGGKLVVWNSWLMFQRSFLVVFFWLLL